MGKNLNFAEVQTYLETYVPPRLGEMQVMETEALDTGFPIIGPASGYLCYLIARMIGAKRVFELGSGYGYSTAWFARAVQENGGGVVYHVVWNKELSHWAHRHLDALGLGGVMRYHVGEAVQFLKETSGPFDLIFNDIEKHDYPNSLPIIADKLRPGGVLIVDNMLWHGRVLDEADQSPDTCGIRTLTRMITSDPGWAASLVPIHDGLLVAYKK
jgi:caffeoyl-CoA O-methyltransferase